MLNIDDTAPDFELPDQSGSTQSLRALLGVGPLIVYFYPADFTPVCTAQACAFRDAGEDLANLGVQVVGISPQSVSSHERFASRYELGFPILFDEGKKVIDAFGVNGPFGIGVRRATFLINREGRIERRVVSDLFVGSHKDFIKQVMTDAA